MRRTTVRGSRPSRATARRQRRARERGRARRRLASLPTRRSTGTIPTVGDTPGGSGAIPRRARRGRDRRRRCARWSASTAPSFPAGSRRAVGARLRCRRACARPSSGTGPRRTPRRPAAAGRCTVGSHASRDSHSGRCDRACHIVPGDARTAWTATPRGAWRRPLPLPFSRPGPFYATFPGVRP